MKKPPRHVWNVFDLLLATGVLMAAIGFGFWATNHQIVGSLYVSFGVIVFFIPGFFPWSREKSIVDEMLTLYHRRRRLGASRREAILEVMRAFGLL